MTSATTPTTLDDGAITEKVYIYGLREAGTDEFRYIGKTVNQDGRLRDHRSSANAESDYPKEKWISLAVEIEMVVLETCSNNAWVEREKYWVDYYVQRDHRLTNIRLVNGTNDFQNKIRDGKKVSITIDENTIDILDVIAPQMWKDLAGNRSAILRRIFSEWSDDMRLKRIEEQMEEVLDILRSDHW